jgi:hypothetical protein
MSFKPIMFILNLQKPSCPLTMIAWTGVEGKGKTSFCSLDDRTCAWFYLLLEMIPRDSEVRW